MKQEKIALMIVLVLLLVVGILLLVFFTGLWRGDPDHDPGAGELPHEHVIARISVDTIGYAGRSIEMDGKLSNGTITGYDWDFGDGTSAQGEVVYHSYGTFGEYPVILTVTNRYGQTDAASTKMHIYDSMEDDITVSPIVSGDSGLIDVSFLCQGFRITTTYASGTLHNDILLSVIYPNGTTAFTTQNDVRDPGDTQTESIDVPWMEIFASDYKDWTWVVSYVAGGTIDVHVEIVVRY